MPLQIRQVEVFRAVMGTGTVSAAAQLMGISQPAATQLLQALQAATGLRLFGQHERETVSLTTDTQPTQGANECSLGLHGPGVGQASLFSDGQGAMLALVPHVDPGGWGVMLSHSHRLGGKLDLASLNQPRASMGLALLPSTRRPFLGQRLGKTVLRSDLPAVWPADKEPEHD